MEKKVNQNDGGKYLSDAECECVELLKTTSDEWDIYTYTQARLLSCVNGGGGKRGKAGLPLQLGMYEQLPLWAGFFETLGFDVVLSEKSSRALYYKGRHTVVSDTVCYPAKLMHGHIESLLDKGVDFIFMPCESYDIDERCSTDCYRCSILAYYPEILKANNAKLTDENFIMPYIDLNKRAGTVKKLYGKFKKYGVKKREVEKALDEGLARLKSYRNDKAAKTDEILNKAEMEDKQVIILAGRPYYADGEINHGVNKQLTSLGFAVLSEDCVSGKDSAGENELSQWTYRARLYRAAAFAVKNKNVNLVQLVSFGCGQDEIISDEVRSILEKNGKQYTRIDIDEISNPDIVIIRLGSLLASIVENSEQ